MHEEQRKLIGILDELIKIYFGNDIRDIRMELRTNEEETVISLHGECIFLSEEEQTELMEVLNAPRQEEMEEYYWSLVGTSNRSPQLSLLGSLVDKGTVGCDEGNLTITVHRKKSAKKPRRKNR